MNVENMNSQEILDEITHWRTIVEGMKDKVAIATKALTFNNPQADVSPAVFLACVDGEHKRVEALKYEIALMNSSISVINEQVQHMYAAFVAKSPQISQ